jgi:hypothetical protein
VTVDICEPIPSYIYVFVNPTALVVLQALPHASYTVKMLSAGKRGCGATTRFPAASYSGATQSGPDMFIMLAISFDAFDVRDCSSIQVPALACFIPDQFDVLSSVQHWANVWLVSAV